MPGDQTLKKSKIVLLGIIVVVIILIGVVVFHGASAFAADGTISDSMCGRKHIMQGASDAECTEACINAGASYILVSDNKIYTLYGDVKSVKPFAGKQVHVAGKLSGNTITLASIAGL